MAYNLDKMSLKELQELESRLQKVVVATRDRERAEVKAKLEAMAAESGFTIGELFGGRSLRKAPSAAKFANPDNRAETWTGRGRKPNWLIARLTKGAKVEDFAIR